MNAILSLNELTEWSGVEVLRYDEVLSELVSSDSVWGQCPYIDQAFMRITEPLDSEPFSSQVAQVAETLRSSCLLFCRRRKRSESISGKRIFKKTEFPIQLHKSVYLNHKKREEDELFKYLDA